MRRRDLAISIIVIFTSLVLAWSLLPQTNTNISPTTETVQAKITAFSVNWGGLPPIVGVTMAVSFNLTVQNIGTNALSGLNILLERITNDSDDSQNYDYWYRNQSFALHVGESSQVGVDLFVDLNRWSQMVRSNQNFQATLKVNETVLDERRLFGYGAVPPVVSVASPENTNYTSSEVSLNYTADKPVNWTGYSLDGKQNVTLTENTTLTRLSSDLHNIVVYANDTYGNMGASETVNFNVSQPFPTTLAAAVLAAGIAAIVVSVILYYRKKKK